MDREACAYISSYLAKLDPGTLFLGNANPHQNVSPFFTALKALATQSKSQKKLNFIEVETAIKIKLYALLRQLNQRRNWVESVSNFLNDCFVEE